MFSYIVVLWQFSSSGYVWTTDKLIEASTKTERNFNLRYFNDSTQKIKKTQNIAYLTDESFEHWHESELYMTVQFGPRRKQTPSQIQKQSAKK